MNCYLHSDRPATAYCRTCGRALCPEDQREIYGVIYCQECLARPLGQAPPAAAAPGIAAPAAAPASTPGTPSPGLALALGFIPGVGAVYNGQYLKAFVQVVIFAFLIAMENSVSAAVDTFFGLAIAAFYFYMVIDSFHTAKRLQAGLPADDFLNLGGGAGQPINAPVAAIVLIVIGVIFLLRSMGFFYYDISRFFWPAILIAVGIYLWLRQRGPQQG
ncbi:MAG: B-box zinc finger protein [Terriglobales bacterium]